MPWERKSADTSYLEGTHNALAAFGSNRDGKKGKLQIVIGLLRIFPSKKPWNFQYYPIFQLVART